MIQNKFLELLQQPRCKTAMMCISIIVFLTLSITEIQGTTSEFLKTLAFSLVTFWAGRASKTAKGMTQ